VAIFSPAVGADADLRAWYPGLPDLTERGAWAMPGLAQVEGW
jgi:hypothetical protein